MHVEVDTFIGPDAYPVSLWQCKITLKFLMLYKFFVLFRQKIEMKQCSAYGKVRQHHEVSSPLQNLSSLVDYEAVDENDGVYEKIPGES